MDFVTDLLTEPATPRLTTYSPHGRMELSGQTLSNWQAKVANLLTSIGAQPGDVVLISAPASWQPAVIALGAWKIGCSIASSFEELTQVLEVASSSTDAPLSPLVASSQCSRMMRNSRIAKKPQTPRRFTFIG